jgi:ATP-dependent Lhr-like helicase
MSALEADENILLAAKIWKIVEIDYKAKKIFVIPAKDGKKPIYFGSGGEVHPKIREKMLEVISTTVEFDELNNEAAEAIRLLRQDFKCYIIQNVPYERPLIVGFIKRSCV